VIATSVVVTIGVAISVITGGVTSEPVEKI